MANYTYPSAPNTIRFGQRDTLDTNNPEKIIKGEQFDPEFDALVIASASKMNNTNPEFTGTMTGNGGAGRIEAGTW